MLNLILLQQATGQQNPYSSLIFFAAIILIFYFFMIRPQMKKQKELKKYRENLKKGDKVVTAGGIYGKVLEVSDATVMLEIDQNVKVRVDKGSVVRGVQDLTETKK